MVVWIFRVVVFTHYYDSNKQNLMKICWWHRSADLQSNNLDGRQIGDLNGLFFKIFACFFVFTISERVDFRLLRVDFRLLKILDEFFVGLFFLAVFVGRFLVGAFFLAVFVGRFSWRFSLVVFLGGFLIRRNCWLFFDKVVSLIRWSAF